MTNNEKLFDLIMFDGAFNVQKAGNIMAQHYKRVTFTHCPAHAHVVSLNFQKIIKVCPYSNVSKFCKMVSDF